MHVDSYELAGWAQAGFGFSSDLAGGHVTLAWAWFRAITWGGRKLRSCEA
jgi:hypothetical protein